VKDVRSLRAARSPAVLGTVDLWGMVVEHERGFRGRFAYPQRLGLICQFCFWQDGAEGAPVAGVVRDRGRRLVPMCDAHISIAIKAGYPVNEVVPPSEVVEQLLDAYAVDPIRADLLEHLASPVGA
jgi:hypothetical protein